ncbi:MAG TPA: FecR/PupR family sigma factor regulator [Steroidobacteraceae bacterium]|nr:FecR/PupR family sigma factor regulator [Steroidobacteraceae bacterium]
MSRADRISDEAANWLIRVEVESSPELWQGLHAWLDADPRHRAAFVRLRVAWHRVDALKNLRPLDGTVDADLLTQVRLTPTPTDPVGSPTAARDVRGGRRDRALGSFYRWAFVACAAVAAAVALAWLLTATPVGLLVSR